VLVHRHARDISPPKGPPDGLRRSWVEPATRPYRRWRSTVRAEKHGAHPGIPHQVRPSVDEGGSAANQPVEQQPPAPQRGAITDLIQVKFGS